MNGGSHRAYRTTEKSQLSVSDLWGGRSLSNPVRISSPELGQKVTTTDIYTSRHWQASMLRDLPHELKEYCSWSFVIFHIDQIMNMAFVSILPSRHHLHINILFSDCCLRLQPSLRGWRVALDTWKRNSAKTRTEKVTLEIIKMFLWQILQVH